MKTGSETLSGAQLARQRCPVWPTVPIRTVAIAALVLAVVAALSLTMVLTGHSTPAASGIIWAS